MYGYSSALGAGVTYVQGAGRASAGTDGPMMLEGAYVPPGCSGGPVIDRDRGSVIGVNKGRARDGRQFRAGRTDHRAAPVLRGRYPGS